MLCKFPIAGFALRVRARLRVVGCAALIALLAAQPLSAQEATASAGEEARLVMLVRAGDWAAAEALARQVLQRDPANVSALIVLARARRAQGDPAGAKVAATRADAAARTRQEHYVSAVELAAANFDLGHPMVAQLWQRRAIQMAPSEDLRARSLRDYRVLANATLWQLSVNLDAGPSNNVNNGSLADTVDIGGLPFTLNPDAKALSGFEAALGLKARYRFAGLNNLPAQFGLSLFTQQVALSAQAKRDVPEASGSDYAYSAVELSLGQQLSPADTPLRFRVDGLVGRNWYGGEALSDYLRLGGGAQWGDPRRAVTGLSVTGERQLRRDSFRYSANVMTLALNHDRRLGTGDRLGLALALRRARSEAIEIDHSAVIGRLSYDLGKPIGGVVSLGGALELESRRYDASPYGSGARHDLRTRLALQLGFPKLDYYGFSPVLRLESEEVRSDVDFYDSSRLKLRLGLRSVF